LCILEHPTQYDPPLWLALARRNVLQPEVWYASGLPPRDFEAQRQVEWGPERREVIVVQDADLLRRLRTTRPKPDAILTAGWKAGRTRRTVAFAKALGIPLILPSDKTREERPAFRFLGPFPTLAQSVTSRLFDGFFTTGLLGTMHLRRLGVPPARIATGLYPIDIEYWARRRAEMADASQRYRSRLTGTFIVLAVSKMSARENPLLVVEGFAALRGRVPGARLVFVGDGELREDVHRRVIDLGLSPDVHLPGYVKYTDLPLYYGAADAFVHVPRREPWGISVSEAMAFGLPVVASRSTGAAVDLIVPAQNGFILFRDDPEELAGRLHDIFRHPDRPKLARAALQHASTVGTVAAARNLERLVDALGTRARWDPLVRVLARAVRRNPA
jgi:glycosyltransferase involved in cell wall biosynthesis